MSGMPVSDNIHLDFFYVISGMLKVTFVKRNTESESMNGHEKVLYVKAGEHIDFIDHKFGY